LPEVAVEAWHGRLASEHSCFGGLSRLSFWWTEGAPAEVAFAVGIADSGGPPGGWPAEPAVTSATPWRGPLDPEWLGLQTAWRSPGARLYPGHRVRTAPLQNTPARDPSAIPSRASRAD